MSEENDVLHTCIESRIKNLADTRSFFFIQIGANDGISGDPLHEYIWKYKWRGVLIEPVPFLFEKLLNTYKGLPNLFFENKAVAKKVGTKTFYRIARKTEPEKSYWYDQLGSFKKDVVLSHLKNIPNEDKQFVSEKVETITFQSIIEKYAIDKIDLLHLDTEGFDYEIIKMIPFKKIKPGMILYEHRHLKPQDKKKCEKYLKRHGFEVIVMKFDTLCLYDIKKAN